MNAYSGKLQAPSGHQGGEQRRYGVWNMDYQRFRQLKTWVDMVGRQEQQNNTQGVGMTRCKVQRRRADWASLGRMVPRTPHSPTLDLSANQVRSTKAIRPCQPLKRLRPAGVAVYITPQSRNTNPVHFSWLPSVCSGALKPKSSIHAAFQPMCFRPMPSCPGCARSSRY